MVCGLDDGQNKFKRHSDGCGWCNRRLCRHSRCVGDEVEGEVMEDRPGLLAGRLGSGESKEKPWLGRCRGKLCKEVEDGHWVRKSLNAGGIDRSRPYKNPPFRCIVVNNQIVKQKHISPIALPIYLLCSQIGHYVSARAPQIYHPGTQGAPYWPFIIHCLQPASIGCVFFGSSLGPEGR